MLEIQESFAAAHNILLSQGDGWNRQRKPRLPRYPARKASKASPKNWYALIARTKQG